jgi:AAA+ superfamily predicted ATPase
MSNDSSYSGCLKPVCVISFLMSLVAFALNSAMGIILLLVALGTLVMVMAVQKNEKEEIERAQRRIEVKNITLSYFGTSITKRYFMTVKPEIEKIIALFEKLWRNYDFIDLVEENKIISLEGNDGTNTKELIKMLFLMDMTKCFIDLGHESNFRKKEGFGLYYFICRTFNAWDIWDMSNFDNLKRKTDNSSCNDEIKIVKQVISNIKTNPPLDEMFFIAKLLGHYDNDLRQKYLIMLYRYASLTAKADGVVNDTEAEWLSKILSLSQKPTNSGNDETSDDREKEEKIAKNSKSIQPKISKLKSLIGLTSVKKEIETLTNFIKIQQQREAKGLKTSTVSYHCVFTGNPGTGKTTVARIVADIYKSLGILAKGHLVETDRSGLVAEYVGQTAVKTNKIIDSALDGVLFIDEAYSLISNSQNDYGKEAIATLLKRMEDNRDRLVVILAGYSVEMQQFIDSNPGLQSRFNRYIEFPDYSAEELYQIFEKNAKEFDYKISRDAQIPLKTFFENKVVSKDKNFGNARFVRNLFEKTIERQANRLSKEVDLTDERLSKICTVDIPM